MNPHDLLRIVLDEARQEWRAFAYVMQAHENYSVKRAGVAGLRARVLGDNQPFTECWLVGGRWFAAERLDSFLKQQDGI